MNRLIAMFLSFIRTVLLCVPFLSTETVHAEVTAAYEFSYTAENGTCTITGISNAEPELTVPASLDGNQVTGIASQAFVNNTVIENVTLPETIVKIGDRAFCNCTNLKSINIPSGVEVIEHNTFNGCTSLTGITIPEKVKSVKTGAFRNCTALADIQIESVFDMIATNALTDTAWMEQQEDGYVYFGNVLYGYKGEMPEHEVLKLDQNITCIAECALSGCKNLSEIVFHNGINKIGWGAFQDTGLESVVLPKVSVIDLSTFADCMHLKKVVIPGSVRKIGRSAFDNCPLLNSVEFRDCTDCTVDSLAFFNCLSLKSVLLPSGISEIGASAFGFRDYGAKDRGMVQDPVKGFEIQGYRNTAAEIYAAENGFTFTALDDNPPPATVRGDVNNDGAFDVSDAALLQRWLLTIPDSQLDNWQAADFHEDGKLNAVDLSMMTDELI